MDQTAKQPYKIKKKYFTAWRLNASEFINGLLSFFSMKTTLQFWGIVYDSVSKQPLDPVIVKLLYVDGQEIETCVTDIAGRYAFLARPGKFKIHARKTNYLFPSKYAAGAQDGIYENLYHGEFFNLVEDSEVVAPNIPMDPEHFDWNQKAKHQVINTHPYLAYLSKKLLAIFFWFGFLLSGLLMWKNFPNVPVFLYAIAAGYLLILMFASTVSEPRLWGRLQYKVKMEDLQDTLLELHSADFPEVSFGKAKVNEGGRFLLRANPGKYLLTVNKIDSRKQKILLGTRLVTIGRAGVLRDTLVVKSARL